MRNANRGAADDGWGSPARLLAGEKIMVLIMPLVEANRRSILTNIPKSYHLKAAFAARNKREKICNGDFAPI